MFSLGVVGYLLLTNKLPVEATSAEAFIIKAANKVKRKTPNEVDKRIPEDLGEIIMKAIAWEKEDRYHSQTELYGALKAISQNHTLMEILESKHILQTNQDTMMQSQSQIETFDDKLTRATFSQAATNLLKIFTTATADREYDTAMAIYGKLKKEDREESFVVKYDGLFALLKELEKPENIVLRAGSLSMNLVGEADEALGEFYEEVTQFGDEVLVIPRPRGMLSAVEPVLFKLHAQNIELDVYTTLNEQRPDIAQEDINTNYYNVARSRKREFDGLYKELRNAEGEAYTELQTKFKEDKTGYLTLLRCIIDASKQWLKKVGELQPTIGLMYRIAEEYEKIDDIESARAQYQLIMKVGADDEEKYDAQQWMERHSAES